METLIILAIVIFGMLLVAKAAGNPLEHPISFRLRRMANWLPLGLNYAFLYMGRYNLTVARAKNALGRPGMMTKKDFGNIFGAGAATYAFAFLINGPLTDRIGGRRAILIGSAGSATANIVLGYLTYLVLSRPELGLNLTLLFSLVYAVNMYFQSFGAVSIVKVNSSWFHVRERGSFGGMFGVLISLGIYFAFDWGKAIVDAMQVELDPELPLGVFQRLLRAAVSPQAGGTDQIWWLFYLPAGLLVIFFVLVFLIVRDKPSQAGQADFETGDASAGESDEWAGLLPTLKKILTNRVIWVIGSIELCSGVLRNGIMHWYRQYAADTLPAAEVKGLWLVQHWGIVLCIAGISGGLVAGFISDKVFGSRRGPVAALLYGAMLLLAAVMIFSLGNFGLLGAVVVVMSLAVIGVHGMLSGTATMDFGGRRAAGTAVGIIDGFVYLGTAIQSVSLGWLTTKNWSYWPIFLVPFAAFGLFQALRIWRAIPEAAKKKPR